MVTIKKNKMTVTIRSLIGILVTAAWFLVSGAFTSVDAQQIPQIPTLQVCSPTKVEGEAGVKMTGRGLAPGTSGGFKVQMDVKFHPEAADGYPEGMLEIRADMSDMAEEEILIIGVTFEQVTTVGKHTPTAYLSGRCKVPGYFGCRFWMMVADNSLGPGGTPDVIGFLVFDGKGMRLAHGTGPVVDGDITVTSVW